MAVGLLSKLFQKVTYKISNNKSIPILIEYVFPNLESFHFVIHHPIRSPRSGSTVRSGNWRFKI